MIDKFNKVGNNFVIQDKMECWHDGETENANCG